MKTITLNVEGMSCNHCVKAVEGALKENQAKQATASLEDKSVTIEFDESTLSLDKIKDIIQKEGYKAIL
ncbi:MAG: heavy-metal-associated domain-containing protein [Leptospiraceae bacterium]|nr:heavy-metal-associated domain-containing protein [Leptospiraceae bacterium]MCP5494920.1 heavy-metal-associated domain-containing protein [Leptospiraceae bacterium]